MIRTGCIAVPPLGRYVSSNKSKLPEQLLMSIIERNLDMDCEQFITKIQRYWSLRKKELKKQTNSFLFSFTTSIN